MRVFYGMMVLLLLLALGGNPQTVSGASAPKYADLYIDGKAVEYKKMDYKKRTENMIALTTAISALKLKLVWVIKNKEFTVSSLHNQVRLKIGSTTAYVNGVKKMLSAPPLNEKGKIHVPLRFLVESTGGELIYYKDPSHYLYWVLSADQQQLVSAIMMDGPDKVGEQLTDWHKATIPIAATGITPYTYAVQNIGIVRTLLESGFPINYQDDPYAGILPYSPRYTLLHHAVDYCNVEVVKYLLEQGADPSLESGFGSTPMEHAIWAKQNTDSVFYQILYPDRNDLAERFDEIIALLEASMASVASAVKTD